MRIAFIHRGEGDWIHVVRDDGSEDRWKAPSGPGVPHDLLHYLVETTLGLGRGFWGLVAEGVDFSAVNADPSDPKHGRLTGDVTELLWSEAIAGAVMLSAVAPELGNAACLEHAARNCSRWGIEAPKVDERAFSRLRGGFDDLAREWADLGEEGTLLREFPAGV